MKRDGGAVLHTSAWSAWSVSPSHSWRKAWALRLIANIYTKIYIRIFTISHFWSLWKKSQSGSQWLIKFILQLKSLTITSTTLVWVSDCSSSSFARPLWNVIVLVLLVLLDLFHLLQRHLHPPIHTHTHTQRPAACVEKYRHPGGGSLSGSCCLRLGCSSLPDMDVSGLSVN